MEIESGLEEKLENLEKEFDELNSLLLSVEIASDNKLFEFYRTRKCKIENVVSKYVELKKLNTEIDDLNSLLKLEDDNDEKRKIEVEIENKKFENEARLKQLKTLFLEFESKKNETAKIEITSKNGEFEIVSKISEILKNFAKKNEMNFEISKEENKSKNIKISGLGAFETLRFFTGIVKFVEKNSESTAIVMVLLDCENLIVFDENDLEFSFSKSSGAGGQHINKTESAVKVTHIPTGISAECQAERSQLKNKEKAIEFLKEKLIKLNDENSKEREKEQRKISQNAIFGDTPFLIFDFDKNKVVENKTKNTYNLSEIYSGNLDYILNDLKLWAK